MAEFLGLTAARRYTRPRCANRSQPQSGDIR